MPDSNWPKCETLGEPYVKVILRLWTPEMGVRQEQDFMHPVNCLRQVLQEFRANFACHVFALNCQAALIMEHEDGTTLVSAHHNDFDMYEDMVLPEDAIQ